MKKYNSILWIYIVMLLCLVTSCGKVSTVGKPADEEASQEASEEAASESEENATGGETQDSENESRDPGAELPVPEREEIVFGDEQFEEYLPLLEGKRVALFTNQTGIVGDKIDEADAATDYAASESDASLIPFGKDVEDNDIVYGQHILDALLERGVQI